MKKKIFVLEDLFENAIAALQGLKDYGDVKLAKTYEDGLKILEEYNPHIAFIDLNFPRVQGNKPEELGYEFGKVLEKTATPYIIVTGGYHHGTPTAKIIYAGIEELAPRNKNQPEAWKFAYEKLIEITPNIDEIIASKERYKKIVGKAY